jgi:egghead protein (zeste-white 4 protein)
MRYLKHLVHVAVFYAFLALAVYSYVLEKNTTNVQDHQHETNNNLTPWGLIFFALNLLSLLAAPQTICNILGLTFFDTFPGKIEIQPPKRLAPAEPQVDAPTNLNDDDLRNRDDVPPTRLDGQPDLAKQPPTANGRGPVPAKQPPPPLGALLASIPHLCLRVVTRGCFPELVCNNVRTNLLTLIESGLTNFSIEVVTDVDINLNNVDRRIKQIIVPKEYESSTKAKFKARALQYALEPGNSTVGDDDYIVHLDEETLITRNVVNGIVNFVLEGKHAFGQGLITYTNIEIVNVFTTLADSYRVARDLGSIRFTLAALHRPLFGIKGSFVVAKCSAEKDVSFDHGKDGSIAEDCYFSMIAYMKGYTFDFIMGEMHEKSPFTLLDSIKQRKRWLQGTWLVVGSSKISWSTKFFLATAFYAWLTIPLASLNMLGMATETPYDYYLKPIYALTFASTFYMFFFGLVKSFDLKQRSVGIFLLYLITQFLTIWLYAILENAVVIWAVFSNKYNFYIVQKESDSKVLPSA